MTEKFTAPLYSGESIQRNGFTLSVSIEHDSDTGAPWDECGGHGPVSEWTTRDKQPGEFVLASDRGSKRFHDFAEACRMARRAGWGNLWPYQMKLERTRNGSWLARGNAPRYGHGSNLPDIASKPRRDINRAIGELYDIRKSQFPSARAYHANAAFADYEYLREWCNDQWEYIGVIVTASRAGIELGNASLWGIESHSGDYLAETANDLCDEAIATAHTTLTALTE